jgi:hypothetical protein
MPKDWQETRHGNGFRSENLFVDTFRTLESDAHRHGYEVIVANTDYQFPAPARAFSS